jgi:linoleoyl-CoA desaturase
MGFGMVGIGTSIMHDANHGSYSKKKRVNSILGYLVNLVGGYHVTWKVQHNVLHHSFTNVHGFDEDIENAVFRFSPHSENKKFYRLQAFYAPFFYSIMTIYWFLVKDPIQVKTYGDRGLLKSQGRSVKGAWTELIGLKLGYIAVTLLLPLLMLPFPWWLTFIGFLSMHLIAGLSLPLIFQPAHVINEVEFYRPDGSGHVENSWAIHQFETTANYGRSRFLNWFIGGLDHQIEHHLFPNICHVHYRHISPIVQDLARSYEVPYHQHPSFFAAIRSHFKLLHRLGQGSFRSGIRLAAS